jgi:hypothetical protein
VGLRVVFTEENPCSVLMGVALAGSRIPSDEVLRSLAPGKLLILSLVPDNGPSVVRVLAPKKRIIDFGEKDPAVRSLFRETIKDAGKLKDDGNGLNNIFFAAQKNLLELFPSPGVVEDALFTNARDMLLALLSLPDWIIGEEETLKTFPDYEPKLDADTLLDYRGSLGPVVLALPEAKLSNLDVLLALTVEYGKKAKEHPGAEKPGRIQLGEDDYQYVPSDEELLAGEVGERVRIIRDGTAKEELRKYLADRNISVKSVEYGKISFRHSDVMGSGRFFYASRPEKTVISLVKE